MILGKILSQPLGTCCIPSAAIKKEMAISLAVPIASAAIGAIGKFFGNDAAADAERERQRMLAAEKAKSDAYYRRQINQSFLDTAHGQNWLRMASDEADKIWKREAGATAVTGRTAAADAMAKDAANKLVGDAIAQGESQESLRKDSLEASKRAADAQFAQQEMQEQARRRDIAAEAGNNLLNTGLNIAATTFGGTKLGQSMMGAGSSPAGGGGAITAQPASALQTMGTNYYQAPVDVQRQLGMQYYGHYAPPQYLSQAGISNMLGNIFK